MRPLQTEGRLFVLESEEGEDGEVVSNLKMEMEAWVRRKGEGRVPAVKVVMGCLNLRYDPYAVRITPLSLRKEDL